MRYILVLFCILLLGCSQMYDRIYDWNTFSFDEDVELESAKAIRIWVSKNIEYKVDGLLEEYPKTPQQTIEDGYGDCEDLSILVLAIAYDRLDKKGQMLYVDTSMGYVANHAIPKIEKKAYTKHKSYRVMIIYNFDEIANLLAFSGRSN